MPYLSFPFVITNLLVHLLHLSDNSQVEKFHINHGPKLCQIYHVMYILRASSGVVPQSLYFLSIWDPSYFKNMYLQASQSQQ